MIAGGTPGVVTASAAAILRHCDEQGLASVAFPAVGTGSVGLPIEAFADALREGVTGHLRDHPVGSLQRLIVVLWTRSEFDQVVGRWAS